jgi:hypothetical protein
MASALPSTIVAEINFIGRGGGAVKALGGFRKGHHNVPDVANAVTNGFLGKICAGELATDAEQLFQAIRAGFSYKRRELSLSLTSPVAALAARDFAVEITYALEEADPSRYTITTILRGMRDEAVARSEPCASIFAGRFSDISFALKKGVRVEAVIDTIEALDGEGGLAVDYPSDYRECHISVAEVDARVRCTGDALEMIFPRSGAPAELIDGFAAVRSAFAVAKPLAGLLG